MHGETWNIKSKVINNRLQGIYQKEKKTCKYAHLAMKLYKSRHDNNRLTQVCYTSILLHFSLFILNDTSFVIVALKLTYVQDTFKVNISFLSTVLVDSYFNNWLESNRVGVSPLLQIFTYKGQLHTSLVIALEISYPCNKYDLGKHCNALDLNQCSILSIYS